MQKKLILLSALAVACSQSGANYLTNYNEPNTQKLVQALNDGKIHIVQLGDSHTAGDSMTDALRNSLQSQYGDGGAGWAMPMYFSGQRMAKISYDNHQWSPISSRRNQQQDYTLGGLIAKPNASGSWLSIKGKQSQSEQDIIVSIKQGQFDDAFIGKDAHGTSFTLQAPVKDGTWQTIKIKAKLPLTITAQGNSNQSYIGGWWLFNPQNTGATVSALGINGAELAHWNRWNHTAWQSELKTISPELIVLAYGTNEAYSDRDPKTVEQTLKQTIREIRSATPDSAIMIVSAPEALKSTSGSCGTRPKNLTQIQQIQREVAQSQNTLFWDWQQAMGGSCSMTSWIRGGKASKDGVHFTNSGYQQLGKQLAQDIDALRYSRF